MQILLSAAGYDVHEREMQNACLPANTCGFDWMDLSMPGLDGWGVLRELKADQLTLEIPCMAVTAHADLDRGQALKTGFSAYVSKPFSSEDLLDAVASLIATPSK